jgi:predicted HicB family RNase H-like nuclease
MASFFRRIGGKAMKYKGYHGHVTYDEEAKFFHAEVVGLRDVITFQGTAVEELEQAFKDSVDEYLDFYKELGRAPEKPFFQVSWV